MTATILPWRRRAGPRPPRNARIEIRHDPLARGAADLFSIWLFWTDPTASAASASHSRLRAAVHDHARAVRIARSEATRFGGLPVIDTTITQGSAA